MKFENEKIIVALFEIAVFASISFAAMPLKLSIWGGELSYPMTILLTTVWQ
jgi:hypothetical protein